MKKIILAIMILFLSGCSIGKDDVSELFAKKVSNSNGYFIEGDLKLYLDEEEVGYNVSIKHKNDIYYSVVLENKLNNIKQVILKNDEGLYVITPSLNKSYKFDSSWPMNSSQPYILESLLKDITNDEKKEINNKKEYVKCRVSYPNNSALKYEKIFFDSGGKLKAVMVYDKNDKIKIKMTVSDINMNKNYKKKDFESSKYINDSKDTCIEDCDEQKTITTMDEIFYPMYMPENTYLESSQSTGNEINPRAILTFSGEKSFVLVEEPVSEYERIDALPVFGEPIMVNDTIAVMSNNSVYWTKNNVDYYIASNSLKAEEMISIASSIGNSTATMALK